MGVTVGMWVESCSLAYARVDSSLEPNSPLARAKYYFHGESLEDFDHVLDVVGRGYQLAVNFAHTVTTRGRQRLN